MSLRIPNVKQEPWLTPSMTPFRSPSMRGFRLPDTGWIQAVNRGDSTLARARTPIARRSCARDSAQPASSHNFTEKFGWQAFEAPGDSPLNGPVQAGPSRPATRQQIQSRPGSSQGSFVSGADFSLGLANTHEREMKKIRAQAQSRMIERVQEETKPVPATVPPSVARAVEWLRPCTSLQHVEPHKGPFKLPRGYSPELKLFGAERARLSSRGVLSPPPPFHHPIHQQGGWAGVDPEVGRTFANTLPSQSDSNSKFKIPSLKILRPSTSLRN